MTTADKAKAAGFKSLKEVADMFGVTTQTLRNYDQDKLTIILRGCSTVNTLRKLSK